MRDGRTYAALLRSMYTRPGADPRLHYAHPPTDPRGALLQFELGCVYTRHRSESGCTYTRRMLEEGCMDTRCGLAEARLYSSTLMRARTTPDMDGRVHYHRHGLVKVCVRPTRTILLVYIDPTCDTPATMDCCRGVAAPHMS